MENERELTNEVIVWFRLHGIKDENEMRAVIARDGVKRMKELDELQLILHYRAEALRHLREREEKKKGE
jgi:hypothetical protein